VIIHPCWQKGKQGEYFPSAAVAWQISNEDFFAKQDLFNYAKLRLGVGKVGNHPSRLIKPMVRLPSPTTIGVMVTLHRIGTNHFPGPDLNMGKKTTTQNWVMEFGLFKGRINIGS
jgi:hypothetical protein